MITVFGSINVDLSVKTRSLPQAGETVIGEEVVLSPGGKGANQAHAARLFGAEVKMFGAVGNDGFAASALECLRTSGVDLTGVVQSGRSKTGMALITVNRDGENAIVVSPGANNDALAAQIGDDVLLNSRALLMQQECPIEQCVLLAQRAKALGCPVFLNASPMTDKLEFPLENIDILIVNELEVLQIAAACGIGAGADSARALAQHYRIGVLLTRGAQGALFFDRDGKQIVVRSIAAEVVDTCGAGDTYAGVFAAAIATGHSMESAMQKASAAAGIACERRGVQIAQPSRQKIEERTAAHFHSRPV